VTTRSSLCALFLVPSANHAVKGEEALLRNGTPCRLIPVPRHLSSQCGVCLEVDQTERTRAEEVLRAAGTVIDGTHDVQMPPSRVTGARISPTDERARAAST
jgi:hypothetical protein